MIYKDRFINRMAEDNDFTKESTRTFYDAFIETLKNYISEGEDIFFYDFGIFKLKEYPTGDKKYIVPKFEASRDYRKRLRGEIENS